MNDLQYHDQLVSDLFDAQPQPAFWMKPVWDEHGTEIRDFEYAYCNEEMCRFTGFTKEQLIGVNLSATQTLRDDLRFDVFRQMKEVYLSGKKYQDTVFNDKLNKYYGFLRSKVQDGVL